MKKGFKKMIATVLTAAMAMSVGMPAFAEEEKPLSEQATIIQNMSDREFDAFVVDYVSNAQNSAESSSTIQSNLEELGIEEGDTVKLYGHQFEYYK